MKNYAVTIKAWRTVVVMQAESEDQAVEYANDATSTHDWEIGDSIPQEIPDNELETERSHANEIVEAEE